MYIYVLWLVKSVLMFIYVCICLYMYVYVSIVYMLCSPVLEEIKNLSIYLMKKVSGYSTRSDLKASKVGADTVLAGRTFHSRTVLGKKEFDSIWSLIRSWNSLSCPLVRRKVRLQFLTWHHQGRLAAFCWIEMTVSISWCCPLHRSGPACAVAVHEGLCQKLWQSQVEWHLLVSTWV